MAIIAIDSSGHVGQPPVSFVAARIKEKDGLILHNKQKHQAIKVEAGLHNTFINRDQGWRLKLSAVLIYEVMIPLIRTQEDKVIIDTDFDASNRTVVRRYLNKLIFTYHRETPIQQCQIEFKSVADKYIKIADSKTKLARRNSLSPLHNAMPAHLNEHFDILRKIR